MWLTAIPVFVFDKCSNRKVDSLCCQCLMWSVIIISSSISIVMKRNVASISMWMVCMFSQSLTDVKLVACSWNSLCLITDNELFFITDGSVTRLLPSQVGTPRDSNEGVCWDPKQHGFISVATNDSSTYAVTSDRDLVRLGQGQGHSDSSCCSVVEHMLSGLKVMAVSCGRGHTLVLSAIGVVFSCGLGNQGQLGQGHLESLSSFKVIEALEGVRITSICAGGWHSLALSDCGDVYAWGWNNAGQLGICQPPKLTDNSTLVRIYNSRHCQ